MEEIFSAAEPTDEISIKRCRELARNEGRRDAADRRDRAQESASNLWVQSSRAEKQ
jgi:hypothetical protein